MKKLLIIFIALSSIFVSCSKTLEGKISGLNNDALEDLKNLQFSSASDKFDEILVLDSSSVLGFYGKGLVFENQLQYYDALAVYLKLNLLRPEFQPAYEGAFKIFTYLGYYDDAFDVAVQYRKQHPENSILTNAKAYSNLHQFESAINKYEKALENNNEESDRINLLISRCLLLDGQSDSAETIYNQVISNPVSSDAYAAAADFIEEVGLLDSAIVLSKKAYESSANYYQSQIEHFHRALRIKYFDESRKVINELVSKGIDSTTLMSLTLLYNLEADNKIKSRINGDFFSGAKVGNIYSCLIYQMMSLKINEDGLPLIRKNEYVQSLGLDSLVSEQFSDFYKFKSFIIKSIGPDFREVEDLEKMIGPRTTTMNYRYFYGIQKYRNRNREDAIDYLSKVEQLFYDEPIVLVGLAGVFSTNGIRLFDESKRLYKKALDVNPQFASAYGRLINLYLYNKEYDKALNLAKEFKHFDGNPLLNLDKVKGLALSNKISEAYDLLEKNISKVSGRIDYFREIYKFFNINGSKDDLNALLELYDKYSSENVGLLTLLSNIYNDNEQYKKAMEFANEALKLEPGNVDAMAETANAKYYSGDKTEAIKDFEDYVMKYRLNTLIPTYYSRILAQDKKNKSRASNLAREAFRNSNGKIAQVLNLCYVYILLDRYDLSMGEARKGIRNYRDNPELNYLYGYTLYRLKRDNYQVESKEKLLHALDLGLKGSLKEEALKILKRL